MNDQFYSVLNVMDVDFLQDSFMTGANQLLQLPDEIMQAFYQALAYIRQDELLNEEVRQCHKELFGPPEGHKEVIDKMLQLDNQMGEHAGMLIPIVLVSGIPQMVRYYQAKGIPYQVLVDTLSDLEIQMRDFKEKEGEWGTTNINWLKQHFHNSLFRLGRLQFHVVPLRFKIKVFQHQQTRNIAVFSDKDIVFREDGQVDGTNGVFDLNGRWISRFEWTDDFITGHPIENAGYARRDSISMPANEWQLILKEGNPILNVHIPTGSKMSHELCVASYQRAITFFQTYFPETTCSAFCCSSWLLSPQWEHLLPAESNIVKFQRDYYLFPVLSNDVQTFERVFGSKPTDLTTAPRDTQLQRVILDHVESGNYIHGGAGFILMDSIPAS